MRFACQSCGKAYNLPEERIAEKANVKLKCRVCGAIVEVKRQGEVVAQILNEGEGKRMGRVSEAPAPLISMSPDDGEDATAAIAFGDHILSEHALSDPIGHAPPSLGGFNSGGIFGAAPSAAMSERGLPAMPPAPATGFGSGGTSVPPPLAQPQQRFARSEAAQPAPPPPMPTSSLPPPPVHAMELPESPVQNGSNGVSARVAVEAMRFPDDLNAPALNSAAALSVSPSLTGGTPGVARDDTNYKIMAAFATGMLIGFIIAKLFF